jgi:NADPH-dependent curcumin reductase CurA
MKNTMIVLRSRPEGLVKPENFETLVEDVPDLADGEALVKVAYLSIDAPLRIWLEHDIPIDKTLSIPAVGVGDLVRCFGCGVVVDSKAESLPVGTKLEGLLGWQEYSVVKEGPFTTPIPESVPLDVALNGLGNTGMSAYFGFLDIGRPKEGDTVLVSAAAGSIGVLVCQMAKLKGCRVVGLAGSDDKVRWLVDEIGADAAINYKTEDVGARIDELCPDDVNIYFDNVGGPLLDVVLPRMAKAGCIVACGTTAEILDGSGTGIRNLQTVIPKRLRIEGYVTMDYKARFEDAGEELLKWADEGKLTWHQTVMDGLERAPDALNLFFTPGGALTGKLLVKVADV